MTSPPELLEQALAAHGDPLFRMALLLGGDARRAEELLRAAVAALLAEGLAAPPDEPALLAALAAAARRAEARRGQSGRAAPRPPAGLPPLYRSILLLPLDGRLALGLALLAGYDLPRLARVAGQEEPATRAALIDAVRALAPAAGTSLTDRVSGETCPDVRAALVDPGGRQRHSAAVRGHLASCGPCRSFDHTWGEVCQAVESAMREVLREQRLPVPLAARLAAMARPARRRLSPSLRYGLPPLAVLALVAVLVLPGFTRRAVTVIDAGAAPPADPRALVAQALAQYGRPPADGPAVWHERYETLWYFDDETIAPLHADLWLDRANPARHRIQIAHTAGGAPYELEVGDGAGVLHYALDAAYAPSLYGDIAVRASADRPLLLSMNLGRADQERALAERLRSGPWSIPPFYLRQAAEAGDLRALGRLSEGGRQTQVISFSGFSPLGRPADAPGATAERITVMLAVDTANGRLRSATEISGPPGGTQISRVTWRLIEEQGLVPGQAGNAFAISRAWNGLGEFPDRVRQAPVDVGLPALALANAVDPALALANVDYPLWLPAAPPPGVDRAVLIWPGLRYRSSTASNGLIYLGPDRRLMLTFEPRLAAQGEPEQIGDWQLWLAAGRGRSYTATLQRPAPLGGGIDATVQLGLVATGFTRDELAAFVAALAPLDVARLAAHEHLFIYESDADPAARAALIALLQAEAVPPGVVRYTRAEQFTRQNRQLRASDPPDPYHRPPYNGFPERRVVEAWVVADGAGRTFFSRERDPASGAELSGELWGSDESWSFYAPAGQLARFSGWLRAPAEPLSAEGRTVLDMLVQSSGGLTLEPAADGRRVVRSSVPAATSQRYSWMATSDQGDPYMADLGLGELVTELDLDADGRLAGYRLIGRADSSGETTLIDVRVLERAERPVAEAPAELRGALPDARITRDWRGEPSSRSYGFLTTLPITEALALAEYPIFLLPAEAGTLHQVEGPQREQLFLNQDYEDVGAEVVGANLGYRVVYRFDPPEPGQLPILFRLTQGPADEVRALLASNYARPWTESFEERVVVAGAERDVWIARGLRQSYLFVDLGETFLLAEAPFAWFEANARPLLAQLAPAE